MCVCVCVCVCVCWCVLGAAHVSSRNQQLPLIIINFILYSTFHARQCSSKFIRVRKLFRHTHTHTQQNTERSFNSLRSAHMLWLGACADAARGVPELCSVCGSKVLQFTRCSQSRLRTSGMFSCVVFTVCVCLFVCTPAGWSANSP